MVALGPVGRNVAAGMTGGLGYFLDEEGDFCDKVNTEIVAIQVRWQPVDQVDPDQLVLVVRRHPLRFGHGPGAWRPPLINTHAVPTPPIITPQRVKTAAGAAHLKGLIQAHVDRTGSAKAKAVLAQWDAMLPKFWQLVPPAEKNTVGAGLGLGAVGLVLAVGPGAGRVLLSCIV